MDHRNNTINGGVVLDDNIQYPPQHTYGVAQGYPIVNGPSAPPMSSPPPPVPAAPPTPMPTAVSNTTIYLNSGVPITGYAVDVTTESKPPSLPCCGIGVGWFLFILGWFFGIPWYIGALILWCSKIDPRERPGYIACTIFAIIHLICLIVLIKISQ